MECCKEQCRDNDLTVAFSGNIYGQPRTCVDACMLRISGANPEDVAAACHGTPVASLATPIGPKLQHSCNATPSDPCTETCKAGVVSVSSLHECLAGALLGAEPLPLPSLQANEDPQLIQPHAFFWDMDAGPGMEAGGGFSWYTRIFKLFEEGHALNNQMGMGGTWMAATGIDFDVCPCTDGHSHQGPAGTTFLKPCCDTGSCSCCGWLFQSFEGGPGYWGNELPTTVSKWRVGDSVGCYSYYTGSPLFQFGQYNGHDCDKMGLAQISNQLVMLPDGITFDVEGMVGVSYVRTPLGKVNATDSRNFWTVVLDTENFAGPLAYFIPEFWALRDPHDTPRTAHLGDYSTARGLKNGQCAFEWNTLHTIKASNGDYKLPKMTVPYKSGRGVIMMNNKAFEDDEVSVPLEAALAKGELDVSTIMPKGKRRQCGTRENDARFNVELSSGISVGTLSTTIEGDECVWSVKLHNDTCPDDGPCAMPRFVSNISGKLTPIPESKAPPELVAKAFPEKKSSAKYDQVKSIGTRQCLSSPGPADDTLYCFNTLKGGDSSTWVGYKWYKFTEQPGLQQAMLTSTERDYMQGRIETLHKMMGRTSRWMNAKGAVDEGLAIIDEGALVTPPKGLEYGYVPIALYEGFEKPSGCHSPAVQQMV